MDATIRTFDFPAGSPEHTGSMPGKFSSDTGPDEQIGV